MAKVAKNGKIGKTGKTGTAAKSVIMEGAAGKIGLLRAYYLTILARLLVASFYYLHRFSAIPVLTF